MKCLRFVLWSVYACLTLLLLAACGSGDSDSLSDPVGSSSEEVDVPSEDDSSDSTEQGDDPVAESASALAAVGGSADGGGDSSTTTTTDDDSSDDGFDRPGLDVIVPEGTSDGRSLGTPLRAETILFQIPESPAGLGEILVFLSRFNQPQILSNEIEFLAPELDTCRINDLDAESQPPQARSTLVSGGNSLVLTSPAGTWLTVPRISEGGRIFYEDENGLPSPLPDGTSLDILGDNFPAVQQYPLFAPSVPERLSPAIGEFVTSDTEYRWRAGDDSTYMILDFRNYLEGEFRGFAVICTVVDDGSFSLPEAVLTELASLPGDVDVRYTRYADRLEFRDNIFFFTASGIAERQSTPSLIEGGSARQTLSTYRSIR